MYARISVTLLLCLLAGCAAPDKVFWTKFHGHDEFYKWICQYDATKKVRSWEGPTITYAEQFDAQCFRTLELKERHP